MTRAMLRRPFTALRQSGTNQVPEYYGKSKWFIFKDKKLRKKIFVFLELILTITDTWGDRNYCGLTGIEVVDINDADCVIQSYDARPRDVTILPTNANDFRTLDK